MEFLIHVGRSTVRQLRRRAPLVLAVAAAVALSTPRGALADGSLVNQTPSVGGAAQVHLVFQDKNGSSQDVDLASASPSLLSVLPSDLQQLHASPFLTASLGDAFGQLWSSVQSQECGSITTQITSDIHTSDNSAYAVNACSFGPIASLTAIQQSQWSVPDQWNPVMGQRILLDYFVPDNTVAFKVSSPYTCQDSNLVCAADPQYTLVFDMHILVALTSPDPTSLQCPLTVSALQSVVINSVVGGDVSQAVKDALLEQAAQAGLGAGISLATGDPIIAAGSVLTAVVQTVAQLTGIGVAALGNDHLRDMVSSDLSYLYVPGSVNLNSQPALQGFAAFSQGCKAAWGLGFSTLDASATADGSLRLTLTAPAGAAPTLTDTISQENGEPSFFHPLLATSDSQVRAGGKLTVTGSYFDVPKSTQIQISWNDTMAGSVTSSDIKWGAKGGQLQTVTKQRQTSDNGNSYEPTGLSPSTTYQFQVRDCNALTCTPWSAEKDIPTSAGGSDQVVVYIDSVATANQIGSGTLGGDGNFTVGVVVPGGTPSGQHTIIAVSGGGQQGQQLISPRQMVSTTVSPLLLNSESSAAGATPSSRTSAVQNANNIGSLSGATSAVASVALNGASGGTVDNLPGNGSGQQASTAVTVVGDSQTLEPVIQIVDPQTNQVYTSLMEGETFTLRGQGFSAGAVSIWFDSISGQALGTIAAASDGTFQLKLTVPVGLTANHTLLATESVDGQNVQATDKVFVQPIPR